jgi:hypothetical protein
MDDERFDRLARSIAGSPSRRQVVGGLASGALGILLGAVRPEVVAAACRKAGANCGRRKRCCAGARCLETADGGRRCQCNPGLEQCPDGRCHDLKTDPATCGSCFIGCAGPVGTPVTCVGGECCAADRVVDGACCRAERIEDCCPADRIFVKCRQRCVCGRHDPSFCGGPISGPSDRCCASEAVDPSFCCPPDLVCGSRCCEEGFQCINGDCVSCCKDRHGRQCRCCHHGDRCVSCDLCSKGTTFARVRRA